MKSKSAADPSEALAPLLEVLRSGRYLRMLARPGNIVVDRVDGSAAVDVAWDDKQHEEARRAVFGAYRFDDGCTAATVADVLVLQRPPDPLRRVDDLAHDGRLSSLAGRTLSAAVGCGRNVLVTGPWCACVEFIAAVLAAGVRPAVVGGPEAAAPPAWPVVSSLADIRTLGADRVGLWSGHLDGAAQTLAQASGVLAWLDAGRLDRALMRFEVAGSADSSASMSPLHVLAAIDLVVVLSSHDEPRVREIAEIGLTEEGYRPRLLFASGLPPVPTALVPVGLPGFVDDLARAGHSVLVDELRHAVGDAVPAAASGAAAAPGVDPGPAPAAAPRPIVSSEPPRAPMPQIDPSLHDAPPPGWELDQLDEEGIDEAATAQSSAEDAALAASFGLAPPPPPPGVTPMIPDTPATGPEKSAFEDAMRRARARDAEMQAEDEEGDEGEEV